MEESEGRHVNVIAIAICVLAIIGTGALVWLVQADAQATEETLASLATELADAKSELARVENVEVYDEAQVREALHSASSAGNTMSELQMNYKNLPSASMREAREANASKTDALLDEDSKNQRVEWYRAQDGTSYKWEFQSNFGFDNNDVDVLWLCKSDAGELLAYTTAVYSADTGLFSKVARNVTTNGLSHQGVTY